LSEDSPVRQTSCDCNTTWNDLSNISTICENFDIQEAHPNERAFFFFGNSVNRHYAFALANALKNLPDELHSRGKEIGQCPKDSIKGCTLGNIKFLWKTWPLVPRNEAKWKLPPEHLLDGCEKFGSDIEKCFSEFLGSPTKKDVLIVGSNFAFTSIGEFSGNDYELIDAAKVDIPIYVTLLEKLFPGIIIFHTLCPLRNEDDKQRWAIQLNEITRKAIEGTRIYLVDTFGYLFNKTHLYNDHIHHPGILSEQIVRILMSIVKCSD